MNENKQEEADDRLWRKYCIEGTSEENPTDKMYYEGFMDAVKEARQEGIKEGILAMEKPRLEAINYALSSFKQELLGKGMTIKANTPINNVTFTEDVCIIKSALLDERE